MVLASDTVSVHGCWSGAIGVGHALVDEWRQWRAPDVDTWADRALADVDAINEHRLSPASTTMTNEWANTLRDELLDELVAIARATDGTGAGVVEIRLVGGAARSRSGAAANGRGRCDQFLVTLAELDGSIRSCSTDAWRRGSRAPSTSTAPTPASVPPAHAPPSAASSGVGCAPSRPPSIPATASVTGS